MRHGSPSLLQQGAQRRPKGYVSADCGLAQTQGSYQAHSAFVTYTKRPSGWRVARDHGHQLPGLSTNEVRSPVIHQAGRRSRRR